jgi:hypothetical protein
MENGMNRRCCWKLELVSHSTHFIQDFIGTKEFECQLDLLEEPEKIEYMVGASGIPYLPQQIGAQTYAYHIVVSCVAWI